jgi:hypothetical protein
MSWRVRSSSWRSGAMRARRELGLKAAGCKEWYSGSEVMVLTGSRNAPVNRKQAEQPRSCRLASRPHARCVDCAQRRVQQRQLVPQLLFQRAASSYVRSSLKRCCHPRLMQPHLVASAISGEIDHQFPMPRLLPHDGGSGSSDLPPPVGISTVRSPPVDHMVHDDRLRSCRKSL